MRITHNMLTRNYLGRMSTNLNNLTKSNDKMSSQKAFVKGYENVADAGRALKIRKLIVDDERYLTNVRDAQSRCTAAEDALRSINSILIRSEDRMVEALNGTMSENDRKKIATELGKLQDEVFQIMNTTFADKYVFNAAGNADGSAPFSKDADGTLMYNGTYVDTMYKGTSGSIMTKVPGGNPANREIPFNEANYIDIGYGFTSVTNNASGPTDPNTAFRDTFSGVESFGYGVNDDGVPVNAYSLLGKMVTDLNNNDIEGMEKDLDAIANSMEFLLTSITEVGARGTILDDAESTLSDELINLYEKQNGVEGLDLSEEIIYNKSYENSWLVTLQLGSKILPQSIFDFLR